jgi:hypothetical protein
MNRSSLQLSGRKKPKIASSEGDGRMPARPLLPLEELKDVLASGQSELFLVRMPRGLNCDRLHDQDLSSADLSVDGVPIEVVTEKGNFPCCHLFP